MSIELLKPRIKIINRWPGMADCGLCVGDIIILDKYDKGQWYHENDNGKYYDAYYEGFPHIFKKLSWWEERDLKDMPEYIKCDDRIWRVEAWDMEMLYPKTGDSEGQVTWYWKKRNFLPATKEEYESYLKSKQ